ncbi:MAG: hypothetical protein CNIPEHKO_01113 [Anaerolineales bacterium]|nr:hypothetical protein [Anaerolineales bacterium]
MKSHRIAVFQALFVVFLWATSWVFVKIGLKDIPPVTFAGLRYFTAFLILAVFLLFSEAKYEVKQLSKRMWQRLVLLGILMYAATQGAVFVTLDYLPAVTTNLLMSFSTIGVATLSIFWLSEKPNWLQWGGILLAISGAMIYFLPVSIRQTQMVGVIVGLVGMATNVVSSVLGREINRAEAHHPLLVTVISMGAGSILLLVAGFAIEQPPVMTLQGWGIILWLALANTAFAFTLWNHTLRTLTATQSSVIGGTMMIWVPILAYFFIGENITSKEILGLVVTGIGTLIVQLRKFPSPKNLTDS